MDEPRRIYIAGPMSGHPGFNYDRFDEAEKQLVSAGYDAVFPAVLTQRSPIDPDALAPGITYEDCLARGIEKLGTADAVAVLSAWEDSPGARLEVALATLRGLDVAPLEDWLPLEARPEADAAVDPQAAAMPPIPGDAPVSSAHLASVGPIDPLRFAPVAAEGPTVMVDALGTPAELRMSLMELGEKTRAEKRSPGSDR